MDDWRVVHREEPPPWRWGWVVYPIVGLLALGAFLVGARVLGENVREALNAEDTPVFASGSVVTVDVPPGSTATAIGVLLEDAGVLAASDFEKEVRDRRVAADLKAGTYEIETGISAAAAVDILIEGPAGGRVYTMRIIEGLTLDEILASLADQTGHSELDFREALLSGAVSSTLIPGSLDGIEAWEGMLFPDTYELEASASPARILSLMARTMEQRVDRVDWSRLEDLGVSRYQAMVVASMIEREAAVEEDRSLIASVIYNRLAIGQPLQIDATVLYALGERRTGLTLDDLAVDSPYNTYVNSGLPPTPIGAPRLTSIQAAANPATTDYLYYVLVDASGRHGFTSSYQEFLDLKAQAEREGLLGS